MSQGTNNYMRESSDRIYSPISAWWKHTTDIGSVCLHSAVVLAATPKPCLKEKFLPLAVH